MKTDDGFISSLRKPIGFLLSKSRRPVLGVVMLVIGSLVGLAFSSMAVLADLNGASFWGDPFDALDFKHDRPTQAELVGIRCPILLAPGEGGTVTATFRNPHQLDASILIKVVVSEGDAQNYRVVTSNLPIASGGEQDFTWQLSGHDIVESNFILTRVFLMNPEQDGTPYPARTDSCGIFVGSLFGLKGAWLVALMLVASIACLGVGSLLLYRSDSLMKKSSPRIDHGLYGLAGILLVDMITNLLGWWVFAGVVLLLAILLASALIADAVNQRGQKIN